MIAGQSDERIVPAREGRSEVRERASRFLGIASPCGDPADARARIAAWRRDHHDATHVAFAWKIGCGRSLSERWSDAGEPSGSAGRPIASAIDAAGVTDVVAGVVRWFGGTKLGTAGLARAYRAAAAEAIEDAGRTRVFDRRVVTVSCGHERFGELQRLVRPPDVIVLSREFGERAVQRLGVLRSRVAHFAASLDEARIAYDIEPEEDGLR